MSTKNPALDAVSMDRIVTAMATHDITLNRIEGHDVATANLNGLPCTFALLDSVAIVRADVLTEADFATADAGLFLASNQINSVSFGARAAIASHEGKLVVRTERDIPCAAGMTDEQLQVALKAAVDGVIAAQDAMVAAAEQMQQLNEEQSASTEQTD
ncbi:YbjN domain-containing protein [Corynebacterium incognita]|uniref:YbjN domain-containing protein n=1 Tax=Corynebacterium incognita TaxID=2754725 RepID=A0A7G7CPW6_9CORY|nr:YbjN domain-containing protein [Corynebacterium incognita]QNE89632.1 YbjN domain-containing protein [Corynebacterium incognita]